MAKKSVGELIREARTAAGLSQEALAKKIEGLSASELGKAERGEKTLTQAQLKAIAKATGVTQKSLLEAAKTGSAKKTEAKKTEAKKTEAKKTEAKKTEAKKTEAKKTEAKKTEAKKTTAKKTTSKKTDEGTLTAAEKKLLEAYRAADANTKKAALALLKGEKTADSGVLGSLFNALGGSDLVSGMLDNLKK